ncbi:MAG: hypothetical protein ACFFG0_27765 [Candidatus Thorarchaeota archaeon]
MKYLIKIDQSSIRKNPTAGNTVYHINLGPPKYKIETNWPIPNKKGIMLQSINSVDGKFIYQYIAAENPSKYLCKHIKGRPENSYFGITKINEYDTIYSLTPEPRFLYSYENKMVCCNNCKEKFDWKELLSDSLSCFEQEAYSWSDTICPKCGEWDCCKIEFEKLNIKQGEL